MPSVNSLLGTIEIPVIPIFASDSEKLTWLIARHDELECEVADICRAPAGVLAPLGPHLTRYSSPRTL